MGCRYYVREIQETEASQTELFLNSVPILASLSRDEKLRLVDALETQTFKPTTRVINQVPLIGSLLAQAFQCSNLILARQENIQGPRFTIRVVHHFMSPKSSNGPRLPEHASTSTIGSPEAADLQAFHPQVVPGHRSSTGHMTRFVSLGLHILFSQLSGDPSTASNSCWVLPIRFNNATIGHLVPEHAPSMFLGINF